MNATVVVNPAFVVIPAQAPAVVRDGPALVLSGMIKRDVCAALWTQLAGQLNGVESVDLSAVTGVDSAGLALLAEVADRISPRPRLVQPRQAAGLTELRAAYRLDDALAFVS